MANQSAKAIASGYSKGSYGLDAKGNRVSVNAPNAVETVGGSPTTDALERLSGGGSGGITSSSASVRADEQRTQAKVNGLVAPGDGVADARRATKEYTAVLDQQIATYESQLGAQIGGINKNFDALKGQTQDQQGRETGSTTATLARIGGYLGPSASGTGAMISLAKQHKSEILDLESKRQQAINEAVAATQEKQFKLASSKAQAAIDLSNTIEKRKQDFFQNSITAEKEGRARMEADLTALSVLDPKDIDPTRLEAIDSFYGVTGFAARYLDITSAKNKAEGEATALKTRQAMVDLLKDIPQGQSVTFPDGTSYTGMGSAADVSSTLQVDANGVGHIVAYNKLTGATAITSVGVVGKPSGGGGDGNPGGKATPTVKDNATAIMQTGLEEGKLPDGTYDPDVYLALRKDLKEVYPSLLTSMDNMFLNPSNEFFSDDAIVKLRKKGIYVGQPDVPVFSGYSDAPEGEQSYLQQAEEAQQAQEMQ